MDPRKKDNLTDLVEWADEDTRADDKPMTDRRGNQQVFNSEGELVTLGQKPPSQPSLENRRNSLELVLHYKREIIAAVEEGIKRAFAPYQNNRKDPDSTT